MTCFYWLCYMLLPVLRVKFYPDFLACGSTCCIMSVYVLFFASTYWACWYLWYVVSSYCWHSLHFHIVDIVCICCLFLFVIYMLHDILFVLLLLLLPLVTGLFFLVLLLNHRWCPLLRLQVSDCSTCCIMRAIPSIAVFCIESIECFPGMAF